MASQKTNTLEYILYGSQEIGARETAHAAPSSATMLVSLFLILITFFVVMNKNANPDSAKRKAVLEKITQQFGKPADELQAFGGIVQPKVEEFTVQLEQILGASARVETTLDGLQTKVIFAKELFFYSDETDMRSDKIELAQRTAAVLNKLQGEKPTGFSIISESENFELDRKKITALKSALGITSAQTGISTENGSNIMLLIDNE